MILSFLIKETYNIAYLRVHLPHNYSAIAAQKAILWEDWLYIV